ncbi:MAG: T9SS type A sorting domain-containing protein, partial [Bacteroidia bacterium]
NSAYTTGAANQTPNLFVRAYNVTTRNWTTVRDVTACTPALNGAAFYPKFAREVLEPAAGQYKVAAVTGIFTALDPVLVANYRFLNDITFSNSDFTIPQPVAAVNIDQGTTYIKCNSAVASLSVTGSFNNLLWSNGATTLSTAVNNYGNVTLVARSGCTIGTDTINIVALTADTSGITDICVGSSTLLSVVGNAVSYTWNPGNVVGPAINVSPAATTTYTLTSAGTGGCTDNLPITVTVDAAVVSVQPPSATICAGDQLILTASGTSTYSWQPVNATTPAVTVTPTSNTTYIVDGVSAGGCPSADTVAVTVNTLPVVTPAATTVFLCPTDSAILCPAANVPATITGPGISGNTFDPQLVGPGTYPVTYTYTDMNTGCTGTAIVTFVVRTAPVLSITSTSSLVCAGSSSTLTASGGNTYLWSPGNQTTSAITVTPAATTTYFVTTTDSNNCTATDSVSITVNALPVVVATATDTVVCAGDAVVLSGSGALTYTWNPGNLGGQSVVVNPAATTTYTVTGSDVNNCSGQTPITITVAPSPNVLFNAPAVMCVTDGPRTITGGSPAGGNYFGPAVSGGLFTPATSGIGTFSIGYSFTNSSGCSDTAYVLYTVNACVGVTENDLSAMRVYPNPFSTQLVVEGVSAGTQLELTDALGRSILRVQATSDRELLDTESLPAGMY